MLSALLALWPAKWLWYLTRGSGAVALLLLTASFVLGVATSVGAQSRVTPRFVVQALHRNLSLAIVVFVAVHVASSVGDSFVPLGWLDAFVPMIAGYRRIWTGLGALASDMVLALLVTSLLRSRLSLRAWRTVHLTSYACWPIALVHSLGTGSDTRHGWMLALVAVCSAAVVASVAWRLLVRRPVDRRVLVGAMVATALVPTAIGAWMGLGPLREGWGTSAAAATLSPLDALGTGVEDGFRTSSSPLAALGRSAGALAISSPLEGDPAVTIALDLRARRGAVGIVAVEGGTVTLSDGADEVSGPVTANGTGTFRAELAGADGRALTVEIRLVPSGRSDVEGTLVVVASS